MIDGNHIRIGARGSQLALQQAGSVRDRLVMAYPDCDFSSVAIATRGDLLVDAPLPEIGGKGLFTLEIEHALRLRQIDLAVHSLKDLPTEPVRGIVIGAIPERVDVSDAIVSRSNLPLLELPEGAVIGTSSHRRAAQLRRIRPDLRTESIRGNVESRIRKTIDPTGPYDAAVLATAGLLRLELLDTAVQQLPLDQMLLAPGLERDVFDEAGAVAAGALLAVEALHCGTAELLAMAVV